VGLLKIAEKNLPLDCC